MEEIKAPKKERKFLKAMGDIALTLFRELVLGIGKKVINKVGNKRQGLAIAFVMVAGVSYASIDSIPYPITGNKQKLGWQTTGNGLVYRGTAADTVTKPSNYTNKDIKAYLLVDTVNNVMYSYIASKGGWKFNNSDTVIINNVTDTASLSNRINLRVRFEDTSSMLTNYLRTGVAASTYQPILVSGTNIKTVNSNSLLGSGNISVGTVTSVGGTGTVNGITLTGTVTSSGNLTLGGTLSNVSLSSQVTGTLPIANGGTGATTAATARTALGATVRGANTFLLTDIGAISFLRYNADNTVSQRAADGMRSDLGGTTIGQSMFTLTNPSAVTFPRFNADNTVSALDASTFRTAIGAGTSSTNGTVTSVTGTAPISVATGTTTPAITIANAGVSTTGVVTASTQTFGGAKTFNGVLNASSDLNVTGIASLNGGVIISPAGSMTKIAGLNVSNAIGSITVGSSLDLTSGTLNAKDASVSVSGIVNTTTQSFAGNKTFTGLVGMQKALQRPYESVTGSTASITTASTWIVVNYAGTVELTFPSASASTGTEFHVKTITNNAVISATSNISPLAGGSASTSILSATAGKWATLVSDGSNWVIMQAN